MRPLKRLVGLAALVILAALPGAARAQDQLTIGAFVTLSGISSDVGGQMKVGMEIAVEQGAKDYAVAGKPVKVRVINEFQKAGVPVITC